MEMPLDFERREERRGEETRGTSRGVRTANKEG